MDSSHVFTDFLACEVCWRDINSEDPIPYWISSCGHLTCNDHIDKQPGTSKRCLKCGSEGITFEAWSQDLPRSISIFFDPPAESLDTVSRAIKYQQGYLFNLVSFFKDKVVKQKSVLDGVKERLIAGAEGAKRVQELETEVARLRSMLDQRNSRMGPPSLPGSSVDGDGRKRIRDVGMHSDPAHHRALSSTGSLTHVLPPHRLSLQPSKRNPSAAAVENVNSRVNGVRDPGPGPGGGDGRGRGNENVAMDNVRPASALGQYAYNPNRRASATPVQRSFSDANVYQQQQHHQVVQLPPAPARNPSRLGRHPPSTPMPSRSQGPSTMSNQTTSGGGGASIRAMTTPAIQRRPTTVVQSNRHSSYTPHQPQFPPHPPTHQPQNHLQPAPPSTPRPSTGARIPFYANGASNGDQITMHGQGGGGRPSSRMMIESYDFDDQGFGMPVGAGGGYGASQGGGGAPYEGGMSGRGYMPR